MSIGTLLNSAKTGIATHKPEIMIGIGLAAGVGAIFVAVKETPKCLATIDKAEAEMPSTVVKNENGEDVEVKAGLDIKSKLIIYGKSYWKAALLEAAAIILIVWGSKIRLDLYAVLAAVYGVTKSDLEDLERVISEQPENWKKKFSEKMAESHIERSNPDDIPPEQMSSAEVPMPLPLFWDDQAKVYFRMSEEDLRDAIAEFTHMINTDPFQAICMNDWMSLINHEEVVGGDYKIMTPRDDAYGALKYQQIGVKEAPNLEPARMMKFTWDYHIDTRAIATGEYDECY